MLLAAALAAQAAPAVPADAAALAPAWERPTPSDRGHHLGTAAEQTAFAGLRSAIDGCRGQRQYGDFDPVMMRALLAEALFQRSQAGGAS
jgi:hypothetical protein